MGEKYMKKPVVIDAIKWTGRNLFEVTTFLQNGKRPYSSCRMAEDYWDKYKENVEKDGLKITTLEGTMNADIGDFIIKGVKGEFYPCKPDIFEATYEEVIE